MADEKHDGGESKVKRVWILGAGFSRPLGGPLLDDLFTMRQWRQLTYVFPQQFDLESMNEAQAGMLCVYLLYQHGRKFLDETLFGFPSIGKGELLYQHAEDFLVRLEMLKPHELWGRLQRVANEQIKKPNRSVTVNNSVVQKAMNVIAGKTREDTEFLVHSAKLLMAYECSAFHKELIDAYSDNPLNNIVEPYIPYRDWGRRLVAGEDVLISFNYDLVVENVVDRPDIDLLKLHGSVHNAKMADGTTVKAFDPYSLLHEQGIQPTVKTPGRSKAQMTEEDHELWNQAGVYIEQAQGIIFMGYGLPESDAYARQFLLKHLRRNDEPLLEIEIVLGEPNFRTSRLETTLRQALAHRTLKDELHHATPEEIRDQKDLVGDLRHTVGGHKGVRSLETMRHDREEAIEEEAMLQQMLASEIRISVLPQFAQDYMQGFATCEGGG